jgi:hypothetical protein
MGFPNNKITNGLSGGFYIDDVPRTGDFLAIQVLADTKFVTLDGNIPDIANATEATAPVIPAGTTLFGKFTSVDLHYGRVIAYNA